MKKGKSYKPLKYSCPKCKHPYFETGEVRASGSFWTKIFDIQNRKFTSVTCKRCRYTELYNVESNKLGNVFDFFTN